MFLFAFIAVFSQKSFNNNFEKTSFVIAEKKLSGYKTLFDFNRGDVRKGWWKYAREFGNPVDMRKYYKVVIPAASNDGNVDLMIYAVSSESGEDCSFFLGITDKQYDKQALTLIKDFKKQFYIEFYLNEVKQKQEEAEELSEEYDNKRGRRKKKAILDSLNQKRAEIDQLKEVIKGVERQ